MNQMVLHVVFLGVSILSLTIYLVGLFRIALRGRSDVVRRGLLRTSASRVLAGVGYVALATVTLILQKEFPTLVILVFSGVQVLWWSNAIADVILSRSLDTAPRGGRHRAKRKG